MACSSAEQRVSGGTDSSTSPETELKRYGPAPKAVWYSILPLSVVASTDARLDSSRTTCPETVFCCTGPWMCLPETLPLTVVRRRLPVSSASITFPLTVLIFTGPLRLRKVISPLTEWKENSPRESFSDSLTADAVDLEGTLARRLQHVIDGAIKEIKAIGNSTYILSTQFYNPHLTVVYYNKHSINILFMYEV